MIAVESHLRHADGTFVALGDATEPPADPCYVEGAIELTVEGTPILDTAMWDLVDQLWGYVVNLLLDLAERPAASTLFPDQPARLTFTADGDRITVSCESGGVTRTATAERAELVRTLAAAARRFFTRMAVLVPENKDVYESYLDEIGTHLSSG